MQTALKQTVTVQKGGLIEVRSSDLPDGACVEVIILLENIPIDISDTWSDEDILDFNCASEELISRRLEEEEIA